MYAIIHLITQELFYDYAPWNSLSGLIISVPLTFGQACLVWEKEDEDAAKGELPGLLYGIEKVACEGDWNPFA